MVKTGNIVRNTKKPNRSMPVPEALVAVQQELAKILLKALTSIITMEITTLANILISSKTYLALDLAVEDLLENEEATVDRTMKPQLI